MRTIPSFKDYIEPVQNILNDFFVPTLFGQEEHMSDVLSNLFSLPPRDGSLRTLVKEEMRQQHIASTVITELHIEAILEQRMTMAVNSRNTDSDSNFLFLQTQIYKVNITN